MYDKYKYMMFMIVYKDNTNSICTHIDGGRSPGDIIKEVESWSHVRVVLSCTLIQDDSLYHGVE